MTCFKIRFGIKRRWTSGHDLILSEPYDDQVDTYRVHLLFDRHCIVAAKVLAKLIYLNVF